MKGTGLPILKELLRQENQYPYIGMIGSDTKAFKVRRALKVDGFTDEHIVELRSPIGTNHQTEIAFPKGRTFLNRRLINQD